MEVEIVNCTTNPEELICQAARNDYSEDGIQDQSFKDVMEDIEGDAVEEKKETLILHLLNHGHFGPFEHPHITFSVNGVSRSLMAQITRHRHMSFDIQSMRYVSFEDADPEPGEAVVEIPELNIAEPAGRNVEMTEEYQNLDPERLKTVRKTFYKESIRKSFRSYQELLDAGVAPENARMVLPIGTKINMVFTLNARMLMHVADMRAAADAQWEVREMTEEVLDRARGWAPITFEYYDEEMKNRKNRLAP